MFPGETVLSGAEHPGTTPEVMSTPAGYYIGYRDQDGLPYSRETGYFGRKSEADRNLEIFKATITVDPEKARALPFVRR